MDKKLLTIGETAQFLGVSIDTLRQWDKKQILKPFRPSISSKRYYRREDINNFLAKKEQIDEVDLVALAKAWILSDSPEPISSSLYCETSDVFQARLQRLSSELSNIQSLQAIFPLIIAIVGEIGNNSYNHNLGNWPDVPGTFFGYNFANRQVVLADRGQGILKTLQRVVPTLKDDEEALQTAFTKYISGRAPESRGNGLKFVKDVLLSHPLRLEFYSGQAKLQLGGKFPELHIKKNDWCFHGCLAIINF